jgi:hypothetical protein
VSLFLGAIVVGGSTVWFGQTAPLNLGMAAGGVALWYTARKLRARVRTAVPART